MQFNSLPLHIETRIKAEIENWRRRASSGSKEEEEVIDPFITISRQYGCNAFALAEALASSLDDTNLFQPFTIYGKGILKMISEEEDIHSNLVRSLNRGTHNEIEDWLVSLFSGVPSEFATYKRMAKTICAIAARGHVILIGRGSAILTRHLPGGVHIRLVAPEEWRWENIKHHPGRYRELTGKSLEKMDKEREQFVAKYLGSDVADPANYHLVLNNAMLPIYSQVELIRTLVLNHNKTALHMNQSAQVMGS